MSKTKKQAIAGRKASSYCFLEHKDTASHILSFLSTKHHARVKTTSKQAKGLADDPKSRLRNHVMTVNVRALIQVERKTANNPNGKLKIVMPDSLLSSLQGRTVIQLFIKGLFALPDSVEGQFPINKHFPDLVFLSTTDREMRALPTTAETVAKVLAIPAQGPWLNRLQTLQLVGPFTWFEQATRMFLRPTLRALIIYSNCPHRFFFPNTALALTTPSKLLPLLETLHIDFIQSALNPSNVPPVIASSAFGGFPKLQKLSLRGVNINGQDEFLHDADFLEHLTYLSIQNGSLGRFLNLGKAVNLQTLLLDFHETGHYTGEMIQVDLHSELPKLKKLERLELLYVSDVMLPLNGLHLEGLRMKWPALPRLRILGLLYCGGLQETWRTDQTVGSKHDLELISPKLEQLNLTGSLYPDLRDDHRVFFQSFVKKFIESELEEF